MQAIESLMTRRGAFDYILLETTGLADPGNIAPLFWLDDGLGSSIYLDGVVTLVDAKNIIKTLDDPLTNEHPSTATTTSGTVYQDETISDSGQVVDGTQHHHTTPHLTTAHLQISHADVIVVNKTDTIQSPSELAQIKARIRSINGLARIILTEHGRVPQLEGTVLDLHAYEGVEEVDFAGKGHSHLDPTISTIALALPTLSGEGLERVDKWLRGICWESKLPLATEISASRHAEGFEIHRVKGRLPLTNGRVMLLQGVREVFELSDAADRSGSGRDQSTGADGASDDDGKGVQGKIVVIGRGLQESLWQSSLDGILRSI